MSVNTDFQFDPKYPSITYWKVLNIDLVEISEQKYNKSIDKTEDNNGVDEEMFDSNEGNSSVEKRSFSLNTSDEDYDEDKGDNQLKANKKPNIKGTKKIAEDLRHKHIDYDSDENTDQVSDQSSDTNSTLNNVSTDTRSSLRPFDLGSIDRNTGYWCGHTSHPTSSSKNVQIFMCLECKNHKKFMSKSEIKSHFDEVHKMSARFAKYQECVEIDTSFEDIVSKLERNRVSSEPLNGTNSLSHEVSDPVMNCTSGTICANTSANTSPIKTKFIIGFQCSICSLTSMNGLLKDKIENHIKEDHDIVEDVNTHYKKVMIKIRFKD